MTLSLLRRRHPLADPSRQLEILDSLGGLTPFDESLARCGEAPLRATGIQVLQVNLGKLCNQTCRHCHVDAGPDRPESMSQETMRQCLDAMRRAKIPTLDVTGGAPELHPHFRWLIQEVRQIDRHVIDRSNLTILLAPGFEDLPEFLASHQVEIVASLPCYLAENTDRQRGIGVFEKSITALRRLNALGYGDPASGLTLNLVYNPIGPTLPPDQGGLESTYRRELRHRYGVEFNRLFAITNMPISRFLDDLITRGHVQQYMQSLANTFNPASLAGLMCRTTISVGWDGRLYDCDFNQMLELPLAAGQPRFIRDFDPQALLNRAIVTHQHCYGCTAGHGSSCQGAILSTPSAAASPV